MTQVQDAVIECVPNFSEGRRADVVQAIAQAIRETEGCSLLDVDAGQSTNRTVYTFAGPPQSVLEGALSAARVAFKLIDMTKHKGEHPRMGALDVCPFIPVANASMDQCVELSRQFGQKLATELGVPVYLYECSQEKEYRKSLSQIRAGEYEGLPQKLQKEEWTPDFGPAEFVPSWGATVTGARKFLIAYNVNLLSTKQQAHRIALNLREAGRGPDQRGRLKSVKALGWYLDEQELAQVSMNLTDFHTTPLHVAFEECSKDAREMNLAVVGSEVVGLLPLEALLMAAEYYIEKEGLFILYERQKVRLAIQRLGLSTISEFKPEEKVIEYRIQSNRDGPLLSSTVRGFVESLAARTSAPGGGSASACVAGMGAALGTMVGMLTFGYKKYEDLDSTMRATIGPLHAAMQNILPLIDKDTQAFTGYMEALKLPHKSSEEKVKRQQAMDDGLKEAIDVPLALLHTACQCWPHMETLAIHGNISAISDVQVGVECLQAGILGAYYNVCINLKQVSDRDYVEKLSAELEALVKESRDKHDEILQLIKDRK